MNTIKKRILKSGETKTYAQYKMAGWLKNLLKSDLAAFDHRFFQCVYWLLGDLRSLVRSVYKGIHDIDEKTLSAEDERERQEALKILRAMWREWSNNSMARNFDDVVSDHPCIVDVLAQSLIKCCEDILQGPAAQLAIYERAKKDMKKFFALSPEALEICEFAYLIQINMPLEEYFESSLGIWKGSQRNVLACILNMDASGLEEVICELHISGVLDKNRNYRLSYIATSLWEATSSYTLDRFFCTILNGEVLPLEKFRVAKEDLNYVKGLLSSKGDAPVHILLYGPPGTGKTTFVRSLADSLKLQAWSVNSRDDDNDSDRRAALIACLNIARRKKGGFVLVDEAERMLDTSWHGGGREKDKAWLNALLEKTGNHVIWIANYIGHIDAAVLRRFSFSVQFHALNKKERQDMWEDIIARHEVGDFFTEHQVKTLADKHPVSAAVMDKAVTQAKNLGYTQDGFFPAVECSLRAYSRMIHNGGENKSRNMNEVEAFQDFTPEGITLDGSLSDLMSRFHRADAAMRENKRPLPGGCASLLFYGPPGTGKTALARHIAHELDRKCVVQRASDLLNCYVGGTEKLIASAFRSAEEEGSVLVFDEVDTFLYSRETAEKSWEVSMVNEFLTALEECRFFCICTTNRFENLDPAAIRRFAYKVPFTYAQPGQIMALYDALLAPLCGSPLPSDLEKELKSFTHLTPSDFRTVCSQYGSLFSDELSVGHETLISALRKEESVKAKFLSRKAGF